MIGFSWVPITALFCYLFLFLTFLASKKSEKVIRSFMLLMLIMILWVGGSFAMRMQLWPSVNFWHHVSVMGMILVLAGYYVFVLDFLEDNTSRGKYLWLLVYLGIFALNCRRPLKVTVDCTEEELARILVTFDRFLVT